MLYNILKIFHILSASLLLTGMGYSVVLWKSNTISNNISSITNRIQLITTLMIIPLAILQLISGFTIMSIQQYDFNALWMRGAVTGFILLLIGWFGFIYFLMNGLQAGANQSALRRIQGIMLTCCAIALLIMVYFMANKTGM